MPLELEDQPRLIFEHNPLQVVVVQVRFRPIFALEQPAGIAPLQEAIRDDYPLAEPRGQELSIALGPGLLAAPHGQPGAWRFQSADGSWTVAVTTDFVSLETSDYRHYEDFRDRAERLLEAIEQTLRISRRERLGLRYVNEVKHPDALTLSDWKRFLHEDLLGIAGGELLEKRVTRSLQQIQLALDDGNLTINHGYVRPSDDESVYAIDIDAFDPTPEPFSVKETLERMDLYKRWVWNFFRRSITDELVSYLTPVENNA